ncbi:MAG: hypothetical protein JKY61_02560 [Planctomycetes bacterium]|nr:hypothetical protein [Planctomycetota bacterium]
MNIAPLAALAFFVASCTSSLPAQGHRNVHIHQRVDGYLLSFEDPAGQSLLSLKQFLDEVERTTRFKFEYSSETAIALASMNVRLNGSKLVPEDRFASFLQILLVMNDFIGTELEPAGSGHFRVDSMLGKRRGGNPRIRSSNPSAD